MVDVYLAPRGIGGGPDMCHGLLFVGCLAAQAARCWPDNAGFNNALKHSPAIL